MKNAYSAIMEDFMDEHETFDIDFDIQDLRFEDPALFKAIKDEQEKVWQDL